MVLGLCACYVDIDVERDVVAMAFVRRVNDGRRLVPTIVFPGGDVRAEPRLTLLVGKLGVQL